MSKHIKFESNKTWDGPGCAVLKEGYARIISEPIIPEKTSSISHKIQTNSQPLGPKNNIVKNFIKNDFSTLKLSDLRQWEIDHNIIFSKKSRRLIHELGILLSNRKHLMNRLTNVFDNIKDIFLFFQNLGQNLSSAEENQINDIIEKKRRQEDRRRYEEENRYRYYNDENDENENENDDYCDDGSPASIVYYGSDGAATRKFCSTLEKISHLGKIAAQLFRSQKASSKAKVYRGSLKRSSGSRTSYRDLAYQRKGECLTKLCDLLSEDSCGLIWGWGRDKNTNMHTPRNVIYIELPQGQVSFHSNGKCKGPGLS